MAGWIVGQHTQAVIASPPLASGDVPYADANGNLAQDAGFTFNLNGQGIGQKQLVLSGDNGNTPSIGPSMVLYNPKSSGDVIVAVGMSNNRLGAAGDGTHGVQFGWHDLGVDGDIPGVLGAHVWVRENQRFYVGVSNIGAIQLVRNNSSGQFYLTPYDADAGDATKDAIVDLGRWTEAGIGGEGYTRKLRIGSIKLKNMLQWGGGAGTTVATNPALKAVGTALAVRDSQDANDAPVTCKSVAASGGLAAFGAAPPGAKPTVGAITNSVTSGGSANTIANFTNLSTYSTDAPTIRNDIYQLTVLVSAIQQALSAAGICT
jgi:hypothetical protein